MKKNKNRLITFVLAIAFSILLISEHSYAKDLYRGRLKNSIYLRPEKNSKEYVTIFNKDVLVEGELDGAWLKINHNGKEAYLASKYIEKIESSTQEFMEGYLSSSLYVRPLKSSKKSLGILPKGSKVKGIREGAWLNFEYEGQNAYIAHAFIQKNPPSDGKRIIKGYSKSDIFIRPEKNSSQKLGIFPKGGYVEGKEDGAWLEFTFHNQKAYIAKALIHEKEEEKVVKKGYTTSSLFIRPSIGSKENIGILPKGTYVEGIENGAWLEFQFRGKTAYIAGKFLQKNPLEDQFTGYVISNIRLAKSLDKEGKADYSNIENLDLLVRGDKVEGKVQGNYLEINHQSKKAYIPMDFVSKEDPGKEYFAYTAYAVNVYSSPSSNKLMGQLEKGSSIHGILKSGWLEIDYQGAVGFIPEKSIQKEYPYDVVRGIAKDIISVYPTMEEKDPIGSLGKYAFLEGYDLGDWLEIDFRGKKAYIVRSGVLDDTYRPMEKTVSGYASGNLFVYPYRGADRFIGTIEEGSFIEGIPFNDWLEISYEGINAFIYKELVDIHEGEEKDFVAITSSFLPMYQSKDEDYPVSILSINQWIKGQDQGDWVYIKNDQKGQYVPKSNIIDATMDVDTWLKENDQRREAFAKGAYLDLELFNEKLLKLVNQERAKYKLTPLVLGVHMREGAIEKTSILSDLYGKNLSEYRSLKNQFSPSYYSYLHDHESIVEIVREREGFLSSKNLALITGKINLDHFVAEIFEEWTHDSALYAEMMSSDHTSFYMDMKLSLVMINEEESSYPLKEKIILMQVFD